MSKVKAEISNALALANPANQLALTVGALGKVVDRLSSSVPKSRTPAPQRQVAAPPRPRPRARRRQTQVPKGSSVGLSHAVCAITNPFCDESRLSKWPDESAGSTLAQPVRQRITLTTDANGRAAVAFTSTYAGGIIPGTLSVGGAFQTVQAAPGPPPTYFVDTYQPNSTSFDQYRLVSGGVRVMPITSAVNSQGIINMIEIPPIETLADISGLPTTVKSYPSYESMPLRATDALYGQMRPSGPEARMFHDAQFGATMDESNTAIDSHDWSCIVVTIEGGAASTAVAVVDIFMNFELMVTADANSVFGILAGRPPPANPFLTRGSTALLREHAIYRGTDESVDRSFLEKASSYVSSAAGFLRDNSGTILNLAAAGAHAYSGNLPAAGGHLMMLGNVPRNVD
jgi:hypothetical protein